MGEYFRVGKKIWFHGERRGYTIQAKDSLYLICTKPFAARKTVLYSIVDLKEKVRGTEDLVFCMGFENRKLCREALKRLQDGISEVSHRNRVHLHIVKMEAVGATRRTGGRNDSPNL